MRRTIPAATTLAAVALFLLAAARPAAAGPAAYGDTHVVQPGETLFRIALRYGVTVDLLAEANGLSNPTLIRPGQVLKIPKTGPRERGNAGTKTQSTKKQAAAKPAAPTRTVSYRYTVSRGDTLYAIARRFGTTVEVLKRTNGLGSDLIRPGQRLLIPGVKVSLRVPPPGPTIKMKVPAEAAEAQPAPGPTAAGVTVGDTVTIQRPLRVRRGPGTYFTTLALVAPRTQLQVTAESNGWYELQLPGGDAGWVRQEDLREVPVSRPNGKGRIATGDVIVREAMQYLGTRYVWGGVSSGGVDCSGFVYVVFSAFSPDLLRMASYDYFRMGVPVSQAELQPGDLVFFTTYAPGASHVGIYLGDRKFIAASSSTRQVTISSLDEPYYTARYVGARRLAESAPAATP